LNPLGRVVVVATVKELTQVLDLSGDEGVDLPATLLVLLEELRCGRVSEEVFVEATSEGLGATLEQLAVGIQDEAVALLNA
jgi:hypothetical protein